MSVDYFPNVCLLRSVIPFVSRFAFKISDSEGEILSKSQREVFYEELREENKRLVNENRALCRQLANIKGKSHFEYGLLGAIIKTFDKKKQLHRKQKIIEKIVGLFLVAFPTNHPTLNKYFRSRFQKYLG